MATFFCYTLYLPAINLYFRFLANEYGLAGRTNLEKAQADEIVDAFNDLSNAAIPSFMCTDPEEKKGLLGKYAETVTAMFQKLEKRLEARGGQFFAGNCLTWADLQLLAYLDTFGKMVPNALDNCPKMKDLNCRVGELPNIKNWMSTRPQSSI